MLVASSSPSPPTLLLPHPSRNPTCPPPSLLQLQSPHHRRLLLLGLTTSSISLFLLRYSPAATSRGLFQMPPARLSNRYFLVRAGESVYEETGVLNTNPVTKTSVDSGLSPEGKRQAVRAAFELQTLGACSGSCWIWPSITQRAYQAAEIIAYVNGIDRSRIVPEYSFLDARGLRALEGRSLDAVSEPTTPSASKTKVKIIKKTLKSNSRFLLCKPHSLLFGHSPILQPNSSSPSRYLKHSRINLSFPLLSTVVSHPVSAPQISPTRDNIEGKREALAMGVGIGGTSDV